MKNATYDTTESLLTKCFDRSLQKVIACLRKKFFFDAHTTESLASEGLEYAARYYLNGADTANLTDKTLTSLAVWKAQNLAADLLRRQQRHPEALVLDDAEIGEDGETVAESPLLARASMRAWNERSANVSWRRLGAYAYERLDEMFDLLRLNPLRRRIFRDIYLEKRPVAEVCAEQGIKPNYAYGIVFGVKEGLSRIGPAFLRAA